MDEARLAVLLCTYNGEKYIEEQLGSILNQTYLNIDVWVSDDGSSDKTVELLQVYKNRWNKGRFVILFGPQEGYCANFLSLVWNNNIDADYFAFCDQDDIWTIDKVSLAIKSLSEVEDKSPALYCSRTELMFESANRKNAYSKYYGKLPSFRNALVQSIAGGNTMVFNKKARNLVCRVGYVDVISHDWWLYMLVSGSGGAVLYDKTPRILYRQHQNNRIGENKSILASVKRLKQLFGGRYKHWNTVNQIALESAECYLTLKNRHILNAFVKARSLKFFYQRAFFLRKSRVYRQSSWETLALILAVIFKKV